jgi:hypothetical protein
MLFWELTPVFDTSAKDKRWKTDKAEIFGRYFNFNRTYIIILKYLQNNSAFIWFLKIKFISLH